MAEDFERSIEAFRFEQLADWPLARDNYAGLEKVKTATITIDGCQVSVQFNPERVRSTTAKTDAKSIEKRPCFLCKKNRPKEQKGIQILEHYEILVNPFPIFEHHLTIPHKKHKKQLLSDALPDLLKIAERLDNYIVFYNGPFCGASAPDHLHFQAIGSECIPAFKWAITFGKSIYQSKQLRIKTVANDVLKEILFESNHLEPLLLAINECLNILPIKSQHDEPMVNLLCQFQNGNWKVILIPRLNHRPEMYFAEGEEHFAISPASVDLGGVLVLPFQKDFDRINSNIIKKVSSEVCFSTELMEDLSEKLKQKMDKLAE